MSRILTILTLAAPISILAGCAGSATIVRGDVHGGEIALQGAYMPSALEARSLMVAYCDGPAGVVSGDELVEVPERGQASARFVCTHRGAAELALRAR